MIELTVDAGPVGALLAETPRGEIEVPPEMWGFGGVHGGLATALAVSAMRELVDLPRLHGVTAQFARPVDGPLTVHAELVRAGRSASVATAEVRTRGRRALTLSAVFGARSSKRRAPEVAPIAPDVPPVDACDVFEIPLEFVPFARYTEIRPTDAARPFGAGPEPELTAWIRFVDDDVPPDELRLVTLMDALAPSLTAVLSDPAAAPTVELSVHPSVALARASSPWVLLRARTRLAEPGGWFSEQLDAWGPDGTHLGSAQQLRLLMG